MTIQEVKNEVDSLCEFLGKIMVQVKGDGNITIDGAILVLKAEIAKFALVISAVDGKVDAEEAARFHDIFDLPLQVVETLAKSDFVKTFFDDVPEIIKIAVVLDNLAGNDSKLPLLSAAVSALYTKIGAHISIADGVVDDREVKIAAAYTAMIDVYINENLTSAAKTRA